MDSCNGLCKEAVKKFALSLFTAGGEMDWSTNTSPLWKEGPRGRDYCSQDYPLERGNEVGVSADTSYFRVLSTVSNSTTNMGVF